MSDPQAKAVMVKIGNGYEHLAQLTARGPPKGRAKRLAGAASDKRGRAAALVAAEQHVHHPVVAVLHAQMAADRLALALGVGGERGDVEARLVLGLATDDLAHTLHHHDALEVRPAEVTLGEPWSASLAVEPPVHAQPDRVGLVLEVT
jgi:hypothetical protein